jgi:peptidyl-prolyl cis-trans isomerase C
LKRELTPNFSIYIAIMLIVWILISYPSNVHSQGISDILFIRVAEANLLSAPDQETIVREISFGDKVRIVGQKNGDYLKVVHLQSDSTGWLHYLVTTDSEEEIKVLKACNNIPRSLMSIEKKDESLIITMLSGSFEINMPNYSIPGYATHGQVSLKVDKTKGAKLSPISMKGVFFILKDTPDLRSTQSLQIEDMIIRDPKPDRLYLSSGKILPISMASAEFKKCVAPQYHVQQIVVKTEDEAQQIITQLKKGADFEVLAKKSSIDPSGKYGGDLGFIKQGDLIPALDAAIFSLNKEGELSIAHTEKGVHIIRLIERN